jgi:hypothetical protein
LGVRSRDRGIYSSEDGVNWSEITPLGWPEYYSRTVIGISNSEPDLVYFYMASFDEMIWKYRFIGNDGDQVIGLWENLSDAIPLFGEPVGDLHSQGSYNMVLAVHPENENIVYIGGTNLYRTVDGFSSAENTSWIGGYDTANNVSKYPNHFVDQHAIVFMPEDPDRMICGNDGGIFQTYDNRAAYVQWQPLNNGYLTSQFFTLALESYGTNKKVMGGLMDNGIYIADAPVTNSSWVSLVGGDGTYCAITRGGAYYYAATQNSRLLRFTIDKNLKYTTFARIDPTGGGQEPGQEYLFINPFVLAPENQNVMYLAGGDMIWRNDNLSQVPLFVNEPTSVNWKALESTRISNGQISAVSVSVNPPGIVYFGSSEGRLFRIDDARSHEPKVDELYSMAMPSGAYTSCIGIDARSAEHIMVAFSNYNIVSLFASFDGGSTFENVSGNLEEYPDGTGSGPSVRWVKIVPVGDGEHLYFVGTSTGLYSTGILEGNKTDWKQESPDLIGNVLVTMADYRGIDQKLYVATHGNGIYSRTIENGAAVYPEQETAAFKLDQNYPNPLTEGTTLPFSIPEDGMVHIGIYNYNGQLVNDLLWAYQFSGTGSLYWNGRNATGSRVTPGIYIARMDYNGQQQSVKMVVQ